MKPSPQKAPPSPNKQQERQVFMKKTISLLLVLFCITALMTACQAEPSDGNSVDQYYFSGKVIETYEKSCLIEVTDTGNQSFNLGLCLIVHTNVENCPEYNEGDHLRIVFDGMVAESYPPQILRVFEITVIP